jgi:hypothetical protein
MKNPFFKVDRRPCVHIANGISFGGTDVRWGTPPTYGYRTINLADGSRLPGIGTYEAVGFQEIIRTMQYNWERGFRRFMLNTPIGSISVNDALFPAYGGIHSAAKAKSQLRHWDGARFPNPYYANWTSLANGDPLPTYSTNMSDPYNTLPYLDYGRVNEMFVHLRMWLASSSALGYDKALDGVTTIGDKRGDTEIYIYTGFGIPTYNNYPSYDANYVAILGDETNDDFCNKVSGTGFQFPDPDHNESHAAYLTDEWSKVIPWGISGIGQDVGVWGFNWRKGNWVYIDQADADAVPNYNAKMTNMRKWFENLYQSIPTGNGVNDRYSLNDNFSYFLEGHPWDWHIKTNISRPDLPYPVAGTKEAMGLLSPLSYNGDSGSEYIGDWQHYTKYLQLEQGVKTFVNGEFTGGAEGFNGADPNGMWQFDPESTEIHMVITDLGRPYTEATNDFYQAVSTSMPDPEVDILIDQTVDYWMDYMNRGYVYQPSIYPWEYLFTREINKRVMLELGYWDDTYTNDP